MQDDEPFDKRKRQQNLARHPNHDVVTQGTGDADAAEHNGECRIQKTLRVRCVFMCFANTAVGNHAGCPCSCLSAATIMLIHV